MSDRIVKRRDAHAEVIADVQHLVVEIERWRQMPSEAYENVTGLLSDVRKVMNWWDRQDD